MVILCNVTKVWIENFFFFFFTFSAQFLKDRTKVTRGQNGTVLKDDSALAALSQICKLCELQEKCLLHSKVYIFPSLEKVKHYGLRHNNE